ncbi:MAG: 50S ribosomal protein L4 [Candidatus Pacearchaeota archaeon]|jgi:large subunit ribosomal protein L4e|nr:50S ribosomal protein L4 [Candidatus Pacearchaeota archaeon]MDP7520739.1 50S ribosomal protein L4 [Candidatus Pacearchaeota archaeon]|tara:strand:+ start:389 stop:1201 length:813 start_codon:yes stop_codon:yes gene_type:complete
MKQQIIMKAKILDINGKEKEEIDLPRCFSQKIREDIISKVLEAKKTKQPYSPSPVAGKQHSAKGKVIHRRHVWRSGYGRGSSRVPRKIMSSKGSQFNWEAAEVPFAKGGMRAHPPKVLSMINTKKTNKKELRIALVSAISATANEEKLIKKYERLNERLENLPLIVESKITSLKTKELISSLRKILGKQLFELALPKKKVRAGIGKMRGRKYKKNAGLLLIIGNKEKLKANVFDIANTGKLSVNDLAKGGSGRLTLYTEQSIKELGKRFK